MRVPIQTSSTVSLPEGTLDVCHIDKDSLKTLMELIASNLSEDTAPENEVAP